MHSPVGLRERLERQAAQAPARYRLYLTVLAVAGDLGLTAVLIFPLAAPILLGAFFTRHPIFIGLGILAVLFLAWLTRPLLRMDGRELSPEEAPELRRQILELTTKLQVPRRLHVFLDGEFNASAGEGRGILGLFGTRFALTLGVPLLAALDTEQTMAVVAHEFGHFSRRHGRFGQWLYRAGTGWISFAERVDEHSSILDRAAVWYARKFVAFFSLRNFVYSRQCEYEADRDAAWAIGSEHCAQALTQIAVLDRLWEDEIPRQVRLWQRTMPEPPSDIIERFETLCRQWPEAQLNEWLAEGLQTRSIWSNTHPRLAERLAALSVQPSLAHSGKSAGTVLFGDHWADIRKEFSAEWSNEARLNWVFAHVRYKVMFEKLLAASEDEARGWTKQRRLQRALAQRVFEPKSGSTALQSLYAEDPADSHVRFAYAVALLKEKDESGADMLRALAKDNIALLLPIYARLLEHYMRVDNVEEVERWSVLLQRAARREDAAVSDFLVQAENGKAHASSVSADVRDALLQTVEQDSCVSMAWLLEGTCDIDVPNRGKTAATIRLLVLAVDHSMLPEDRHDETIEAHYTDVLDRLISPEDISAVRVLYTTDPQVEAYRAYRPALVRPGSA